MDFTDQVKDGYIYNRIRTPNSEEVNSTVYGMYRAINFLSPEDTALHIFIYAGNESVLYLQLLTM